CGRFVVETKNGEQKNNILVLTVHGNDGSEPDIYFSLFNTLDDAHTHCRVTNTLKLNGSEWVLARIIKYSEKYRLTKPVEYSFDVLEKMTNQDIWRIENFLHECKYDSEGYMFWKALKGASRELQEKLFRYSYHVNPVDYPNNDYGNRMYKTFDEFLSELESMDESPENIREAQENILKTIVDLSINGELLFPLVKINDN
ncbi:MAG: hypothetical protein LBL70_01070, partial [Treponema sp.]|nr:hypothetical protein [Treponema sp.]